MSKVLKVFVNIILILFILVAAALFVPPLLGVSTVVSENGMETNIQTGSVVYGVSSRVSGLEVGDKIIETEENSAYVYEITAIDAENETVEVTAAEGDTPSEIALRTSVRKAVITVPLIGYVSIAMQTAQGRIVLGLAVVLLIVLFIVAEVWSRKDDGDEEDEEEEDADQFYANQAEQKKKADEEEERSSTAASRRNQRTQAEQITLEEAEPEKADSSHSRGKTIWTMSRQPWEAALVSQQMPSQNQPVEMPPEEEPSVSLKPDEIELAIPARKRGGPPAGGLRQGGRSQSGERRTDRSDLCRPVRPASKIEEGFQQPAPAPAVRAEQGPVSCGTRCKWQYCTSKNTIFVF